MCNCESSYRYHNQTAIIFSHDDTSDAKLRFARVCNRVRNRYPQHKRMQPGVDELQNKECETWRHRKWMTSTTKNANYDGTCMYFHNFSQRAGSELVGFGAIFLSHLLPLYHHVGSWPTCTSSRPQTRLGRFRLFCCFWRRPHIKQHQPENNEETNDLSSDTTAITTLLHQPAPQLNANFQIESSQLKIKDYSDETRKNWTHDSENLSIWSASKQKCLWGVYYKYYTVMLNWQPYH